MLINEIVEYCNNKYRNADTTNVCKNCKHPTNCSGNCKNCLEQIHYPSRFPQGKKDYDCDNLINFYVCDYTNKYASEMLYLLRESEKLKEIDEYHILSIGCGAAPDLMAFEKYAYETDSDKNIFYSGVDVNPRWEEIHDRIIGYNSDIINNIEFKYIDAINYFNENVLPGINVIVLQYVISHFYNTGQIYIIHQFFSDLIKNVVKVRKDDDPFVILINDVNSCNRGRDYFEILVEILKKNNYHGQCNCFYFNYKIQNDCQRYGNKHPRNNTLFELDNLDLDFYKPWEKCSSAQMLIEIE